MLFSSHGPVQRLVTRTHRSTGEHGPHQVNVTGRVTITALRWRVTRTTSSQHGRQVTGRCWELVTGDTGDIGHELLLETGVRLKCVNLAQKNQLSLAEYRIIFELSVDLHEHQTFHWSRARIKKNQF